ncbi:MAG: ribonucleoside triphosphate reductase, partial [Clostridia bacterium]|nr:ribonucleoside triphosphate reductase [Clostridia bacterium]
LVGEQYVCPECGEKTEVYSRITGYYRPVQNWNDGKAQEFKDRKVYDIANSHMKASHKVEPKPEEAPAQEKAPEQPKNGILLFATPTCPNCKIACAALDKAGIAYEKLYANEHPDLTRSYGVRQAPTLVVANGGEIEKFAGVSEIKKYIGR